MKLPRWVPPTLSRLYDDIICRRGVVKLESRTPAIPDVPANAISVAIPHYRRGPLIHRPLKNLLHDPRVAEVVIVDDGSPIDEYRILEKAVQEFNLSGKIRLVRRDENLGAQATKIDCIAESSREWVLLLDSDNTAFRSYLDAFFDIQHRDPSTIYCAPKAFPYFSFAPLAGKVMDWKACVEWTRSKLLRRVYIMNDGNYVVHRPSYIATVGPLRDLRRDVVDVLVANYLWLSKGGKLQILPSGAYHHRIDASSFWLRTAEASRDRLMKTFERIEAGQPWDEAFLADLKHNF